MTLHVYNTLTKEKEEFRPLEPGRVRMYNCGPTVYSRVHIGNLRAFLCADLLRRWLEFEGYQVTQVMNLTDVDDRTIQRSQDTGESLAEVTAPVTELFFTDLDALHIERADQYPKATEHIPEMIALIERLVEGGYA